MGNIIIPHYYWHCSMPPFIFLPHSLERFVSLSYQAQLFKVTFASTLILIAGSLVFFTLSRFMGKEAYKANAAQANSQSLNVHQETRNKITEYATESLHSLYGFFGVKSVYYTPPRFPLRRRKTGS